MSLSIIRSYYISVFLQSMSVFVRLTSSVKHVTAVRMVAVVTNRVSIGIINHIFDCLTTGYIVTS